VPKADMRRVNLGTVKLLQFANSDCTIENVRAALFCVSGKFV